MHVCIVTKPIRAVKKYLGNISASKSVWWKYKKVLRK